MYLWPTFVFILKFRFSPHSVSQTLAEEEGETGETALDLARLAGHVKIAQLFSSPQGQHS